MISRVLAAALAAGFAAALVASVLQFFLTTPLILKAERFEKAAATSAEMRPVKATFTDARLLLVHEGHDHGAADEWKPAEGLSRTLFTALATIVSGIGYALVLIAALLAARQEPSVGRGLAWGLAGFAAVNLAPALGLPPELPGMGGADLGARQAWWLFTAGATGLGLYLGLLVRSPLAIALAIVALVAPHVLGAPSAGEAESGVPAALAAQFAARSIAIAFAFWATLGLAIGWAWQNVGTRSGSPA